MPFLNIWTRRDYARRGRVDSVNPWRVRLRSAERSRENSADAVTRRALSEVRLALNRLPRNSSPVRVKNRCIATGCGGSVNRKSRRSRFELRNRLLRGHCLGYRPSTW